MGRNPKRSTDGTQPRNGVLKTTPSVENRLKRITDRVRRLEKRIKKKEDPCIGFLADIESDEE